MDDWIGDEHLLRRETFRQIDIITLAGSLLLIIGAVFMTITIGLEVKAFDDAYRYYNDHMTEWAILQLLVVFIIIQIAGYILKLREATLVKDTQ